VDDSTGNQYRFTFPGLPLEPAESANLLSQLNKLSPFPDFLVVSGSFPPDFPIEFIGDLKRVCDEKGAKLILDTSGPFLAEAVKQKVYLLKPNYQELCDLAGIKSDDLHDVKGIAQGLIETSGVEILVVSLGANGATIVTSKESHHIHAPKVPVKSTVGAGDSMLAGLVYALSKGETLREALRWGVACGTATTMNEGTGLFQVDQVAQIRQLIR